MSEDYSLVPITKCPGGGYHAGRMLDKCGKCRKVLVYEDYAREKAQVMVQIRCVECGMMREAKPQDAHMVKRCRRCQKKKNEQKFKKFLKNRRG